MSAPRNIVAAVKHLNMTEELNFKFHLIFVNLSLSSHIFTSQNCSTFFIFVSVSTPWGGFNKQERPPVPPAWPGVSLVSSRGPCLTRNRPQGAILHRKTWVWRLRHRGLFSETHSSPRKPSRTLLLPQAGAKMNNKLLPGGQRPLRTLLTSAMSPAHRCLQPGCTPAQDSPWWVRRSPLRQ